MIAIANAPCSWGALEFAVGDPVGWERMLDEMAATGYAGTEFGDWGLLPTDPGALRDALGARGLELVGAYLPAALWDPACEAPAIAAARRVARLLAAVSRTQPVIVLADDNLRVPARNERAGRIARADGLDRARWARFAAGAERLAGIVADETGLRTVLHPHCGGFVEAPWEIDEIMHRTDPAVLGLCLDTGHITFGGGDPLAVLAHHRARVRHVHFKDCSSAVAARARGGAWDYLRAVREGVFCELGTGVVDFRRLLDDLRAGGYDGWIVVEQDVLPGLGAPAESAARNRRFLQGLGV